jgi:hypothetical protein
MYHWALSGMDGKLKPSKTYILKTYDFSGTTGVGLKGNLNEIFDRLFLFIKSFFPVIL